MSDSKSKIVNVSKTEFMPALAYRAAQMTYTKRNYLTKKEAERQGIDLTPVSKAVQKESSVAMAQEIRSRMEDPANVGEFIEKMFKGPIGYEAYEVDVVSKSPESADLEYHYCPLVQAWQSLGLSDEEIAQLCDSAMEGDRIMAEEMGYDIDIQKTIANGDGVCKIVYSRKKQG